MLPAIVADAHAGVKQLTAEINEAIVAAVPELGRDADVREEVDRSTEANVVALLELFSDPALPVDGQAPPEALALVTTLLRRGMDPRDLIQACRVGQNSFWRWWMDRVSRRVEPGPALVEALDASSVLLFSRIDFLTDEVLRRWDAERELWVGGALARRAQVVQRLLAGDPLDLEEASRRLGFELDRCITAAVLWDERESGRLHGDLLPEIASALAAAAGADQPLTLPTGGSTLALWIGTAAVPEPAVIAEAARGVVEDGIGVAIGVSLPRGFRISHEQALRARRVAELEGRGARVVAYADVELVSLLTSDLEHLLQFVQRTIGPLGEPGEAPQRLRETIAAWLAEGGNASRAAERLGLHKNTVLYRLRRAEQALGHPPGADRLALELALGLLSTLGAAARAGRGAPDFIGAPAQGPDQLSAR